MNHASRDDHGTHHDHGEPTHAADHAGHHAAAGGLSRVALMATIHCLTGCAIGEVAGMAIGTAFGWGNLETDRF